MSCSFSWSEFGIQYRCFIFLIHLVQYFNFGCSWFGHIKLDLDLLVMFAPMMVASSVLPSIVVNSDKQLTWRKSMYALNCFSSVVIWSLLVSSFSIMFESLIL